ncbi:UDP-4-amino-4,6-dideoxy-N-acetyl-beta-L-altrosamine transaminase [Legionella jamestowniensis]|uniref:UDP-4-amino-4, 6-dideoxy-N-acetyl-beta-L-altrosamine transaminase n=1 Tax=Legionella jamestowniensis TaxID=455 RepID=A0ABX2XSH4_9GAMM|nr:UDP-4-amino-4,6-dideoxy-N-acetyl-beta-L-altrosamine transaminase [Legionella jamestowniensis]OCH97569.1 UDP-4-amino-4,6-dideoxy-N-acetyl-beta-L-altrosamine transaminase [Legionella jamestowniensis]
MIPYGRQDICEADIDAVIRVLKSDFLTQGPAVPRFEESLTAYCGSKHGVAVNSATSALHIACLALGLGPNDWLWTSPISFVASANCALYCGAQVDFVDIDSRTYNMSVSALEHKLIHAEKEGRLPKIVIPVHFSGQPCDMKAIHSLSQRYNFKIIEDASHAIGGRYRGEPIGNCRYSNATVFSFHPVKIITTAEGGIVLTNDAELFEKMSLLRSHGITRNTQKMDKIPDGSWYYQQIELGFNYRMTELQAALGVSQMERLDQFVLRRHKIAKRYSEALVNLPLITPWQHPESYSALHLYVIRLALGDIKVSHKHVFESLKSQGIGVNLHYIPIHTQPYYKNLGFKEGQFPVAEAYYKEAITLPMYPSLTDEQQASVIDALTKSLQVS